MQAIAIDQVLEAIEDMLAGPKGVSCRVASADFSKSARMGVE
jgi:hypothetical protein